jgi:hypothetical protein
MEQRYLQSLKGQLQTKRYTWVTCEFKTNWVEIWIVELLANSKNNLGARYLSQELLANSNSSYYYLSVSDPQGLSLRSETKFWSAIAAQPILIPLDPCHALLTACKTGS